jgi:hypothetical protein
MSVATFIPTVWSARLINHLDNALVARSFFNQDYEGEISDKGDTVKINQIGNISIFDYERNQDMNPPEELATAAQELIIDQGKAFNFQVDDVDAAQMNTGLMDRAMERSGVQLAEVEDSFLFGLLNAAAVGDNRITATIQTPADMYATLVLIRQIMVKRNVPAIGRKIALPPEGVSLLLQDDRFVGTGGTGAESTLASGLVGRAAGFEIYEVNTTPGGNTAIAGHSLASTYANQIIKTEAYRMERRFADGVKGLNVYGAKVLVPQAIVAATLNIA